MSYPTVRMGQRHVAVSGSKTACGITYAGYIDSVIQIPPQPIRFLELDDIECQVCVSLLKNYTLEELQNKATIEHQDKLLAMVKANWDTYNDHNKDIALSLLHKKYKDW